MKKEMIEITDAMEQWTNFLLTYQSPSFDVSDIIQVLDCLRESCVQDTVKELNDLIQPFHLKMIGMED